MAPLLLTQAALCFMMSWAVVVSLVALALPSPTTLFWMLVTLLMKQLVLVGAITLMQVEYLVLPTKAVLFS
jgi:hypothetical protein